MVENGYKRWRLEASARWSRELELEFQMVNIVTVRKPREKLFLIPERHSISFLCDSICFFLCVLYVFLFYLFLNIYLLYV